MAVQRSMIRWLSVAALAVLDDARPQVRRLFTENIDFLLRLFNLPVEGRDTFARLSQLRFGGRACLIQPGNLIAQLAQLALAGQDPRLGVVRSDRQRAVGFEHLALERDEAIATGKGGELTGGIEIADQQGLAEKLSGQVSEVGFA